MSFFRSVLGLVPAALVLLSLAGCPRPETTWRTRDARVLGVDSDRAEDPVSGRIVLKPGAIKREYRGTLYFFESPETAAVFDRDPTLYAVVENVPPRDSVDVK
jgi:YHS domain-containing protein